MIRVPLYNKSGTVIVDTSEVFFNCVIDWLTKGGMMRRPGRLADHQHRKRT